jgi:hypothetical protein
MSVDTLTIEIRRFIALHIHSLEQLEVLCLLTETPDKSWSIADVNRAIQSSEKSISDCLEKFRNDGLVISNPDGKFCIAREANNLNETVVALTKAYRQMRVSIIECIYSKPPDSIQDFADAFRLRKDK